MAWLNLACSLVVLAALGYSCFQQIKTRRMLRNYLDQLNAHEEFLQSLWGMVEVFELERLAQRESPE